MTCLRLIALSSLGLLFACGKAPAKDTAKSGDKTQAQADSKKGAAKPSGSAKKDEKNGGFVDSELIDFRKLINKTPDEVKAVLGTPTVDRESRRITCVRFVPERVFFACKTHTQRYDDPKGKLTGSIHVEFEDGKSTSVSVMGIPGEGEFTPEKALKLVGLTLPGTPKHSDPDPTLPGASDPRKVDLYSYFNNQARLRIGGLEYRVQVSIIDGEWARSQVEVLENNPLTEAQKKVIKQPANAPKPAAEAEGPTSDPAASNH